MLGLNRPIRSSSFRPVTQLTSAHHTTVGRGELNSNEDSVRGEQCIDNSQYHLQPVNNYAQVQHQETEQLNVVTIRNVVIRRK